jgi:hypothetical protein
MDTKTRLGTGLIITTLMVAIGFSNSAFALTIVNPNIPQPSSDVVDTVRSAKKNVGTALSSLEGVAEGCISCIRTVADKLNLVDVQLQMALMLLGNTSQPAKTTGGALTQNKTVG